eukprot:6997494-Lingulodinium_polyedra.AAC.1
MSDGWPPSPAARKCAWAGSLAAGSSTRDRLRPTGGPVRRVIKLNWGASHYLSKFPQLGMELYWPLPLSGG